MLARALLAVIVLMLALAEPGAVQAPPEAQRYFWRMESAKPLPTPTPLGSELEEANERLAAVRRRRIEVERLERAMREFLKSVDELLPTPTPGR